MGLTKAQRYNRNMDEIFRKSEEAGHHTLHGSTEKKKSVAKKMAQVDKNIARRYRLANENKK